MKRVLSLLLLVSACFVNAQAFKGAGDTKFDIGVNIQDMGTGMRISTDFGVGENMSFGIAASYLLSVDQFEKNGLGKPGFGDRVDAKLRFNANLGRVFQLPSAVDVYPGLDLGLKNFGAHLGARYYFSEGFGVFGEAGLPISKYEPNEVHVGSNLNNQFTLNIGASFNF